MIIPKHETCDTGINHKQCRIEELRLQPSSSAIKSWEYPDEMNNTKTDLEKQCTVSEESSMNG